MSIDFDDWLGKAISSVKTPQIQFWEIKNVEWETARQLQDLSCKLVTHAEHMLRECDNRDRFAVAIVDMGEINVVRPWNDQLWAEVDGRALDGAYIGLWWLDVPVFGTMVSEYYNRHLPPPVQGYPELVCVYHGFRGIDDFGENPPTYNYSMFFLPRRALPLGRRHASVST